MTQRRGAVSSGTQRLPFELPISQHEAKFVGLASRHPSAVEAAMRRRLKKILSAIPRLAECFRKLFDDDGTPAQANEPRP